MRRALMAILIGTGATAMDAGAGNADVGSSPAPQPQDGGAMVFIDSLGAYIDRHEVTVAAFCQFLNEKGNRTEGGAMWLETASKHAHITERDGRFEVEAGFGHHPIVEVSWYGARAYCGWAGKRLPTESEWQQACEGPQKLEFPWGNEFVPGLANIFGMNDGYARTAPVGSFPGGVSPYGALDMAGNAWEWTAATAAGTRYVRGGSWVNGKTVARCSSRVTTGAAHTYVMGNSMGFRCAR